jgi:hypothetical protein
MPKAGLLNARHKREDAYKPTATSRAHGDGAALAGEAQRYIDADAAEGGDAGRCSTT